MTNVASRVLEKVALIRELPRLYNLGRYQQFVSEAPTAQRMAFHTGVLLAQDDNINASALLWIAGEMVDLVRHAAPSLPVYAWRSDVVPWAKAFCVSEKPLLTLSHPLRPEGITHSMLQWSDLLGPDSCTIVSWNYEPGFHRAPVPSLAIRLKADNDWSDSLRAGSREIAASEVANVNRTLCTLWLLLRQKVATKRVLRADRAMRRRFVREGRPEPSEVTVIELRRPVGAAEAQPPLGAPVDWSHRWMVDGHWRNQYHPSDGSHVPTWIAPYVKGPDDKPLVVKDKVYAWMR